MRGILKKYVNVLVYKLNNLLAFEFLDNIFDEVNDSDSCFV